MTNELEIKLEKEIISIDKFIPFGFDDKYFALKGELIYYHAEKEGYRLLEQKYNETIKKKLIDFEKGRSNEK
jgi:hypothetical protein